MNHSLNSSDKTIASKVKSEFEYSVKFRNGGVACALVQAEFSRRSASFPVE
jgi:hypothetical protein